MNDARRATAIDVVIRERFIGICLLSAVRPAAGVLIIGDTQNWDDGVRINFLIGLSSVKSGAVCWLFGEEVGGTVRDLWNLQ